MVHHAGTVFPDLYSTLRFLIQNKINAPKGRFLMQQISSNLFNQIVTDGLIQDNLTGFYEEKW